MIFPAQISPIPSSCLQSLAGEVSTLKLNGFAHFKGKAEKLIRRKMSVTNVNEKDLTGKEVQWDAPMYLVVCISKTG